MPDGRRQNRCSLFVLQYFARTFDYGRACLGLWASQDFAEAREYTKQFEHHRVIYDFGKSWNQQEYSTLKMDLRKYRQDMNKQRDWKSELEKMKLNNVIGVLSVESKTMKHSLVPVTQRTLDCIKNLLLVSAREETITALANFQQRVKVLQERPESLDGFMQFMVTYQDMVTKKRGALKEALIVDEMYELLAGYAPPHTTWETTAPAPPPPRVRGCIVICTICTLEHIGLHYHVLESFVYIGNICAVVLLVL